MGEELSQSPGPVDTHGLKYLRQSFFAREDEALQPLDSGRLLEQLKTKAGTQLGFRRQCTRLMRLGQFRFALRLPCLKENGEHVTESAQTFSSSQITKDHTLYTGQALGKMKQPGSTEAHRWPIQKQFRGTEMNTEKILTKSL